MTTVVIDEPCPICGAPCGDTCSQCGSVPQASIGPGVANENIVHAVPIGDLRDHDTASRGACWCRPLIEEVSNGYVVTHNAMDMRERYERGQPRH
jgi:hypothetical protein